MIGWIAFGITFIALIVSLWYNFKFARIIIKVEDSITESLDILDKRYQSIAKVLDMPLFFDSPQVRQVIDDMRLCRDAILYTANSIAVIEEENDGKDKEV